MIALDYKCPDLDKKNMAKREEPLPSGSAKPVALIKLISEDENSYFDFSLIFSWQATPVENNFGLH